MRQELDTLVEEIDHTMKTLVEKYEKMAALQREAKSSEVVQNLVAIPRELQDIVVRQALHTYKKEIVIYNYFPVPVIPIQGIRKLYVHVFLRDNSGTKITLFDHSVDYCNSYVSDIIYKWRTGKLIGISIAVSNDVRQLFTQNSVTIRQHSDYLNQNDCTMSCIDLDSFMQTLIYSVKLFAKIQVSSQISDLISNVNTHCATQPLSSFVSQATPVPHTEFCPQTGQKTKSVRPSDIPYASGCLPLYVLSADITGL